MLILHGPTTSPARRQVCSTRSAPAEADSAAPLPTYILGWESEGQAIKYSKAMTGGDLCDNISFLGEVLSASIVLVRRECSHHYHVLCCNRCYRHARITDVHPGPSGLMTTAEGLRIAYISHPCDAATCDSIAASRGSVDVLLSAKWPSSILNHAPVSPVIQQLVPFHRINTSAQSEMVDATSGSEGLAKVSAALRPRYHFAPGSGWIAVSI